MDFQNFILEKLKKRNLKQTEVFQSIIEARNIQTDNKQASELLAIKQQNAIYHRQNISIKQNTGQTISRDPRVVEQLQQRIRILQNQLMNHYKNKSQSVEQILNLTNQSQSLGKTLNSTQRELQALKFRLDDCQQEIKQKEQAISLLNKTIQFLNNQINGLSKNLQEQKNCNQNLSSENAGLTAYIIKMKQQQAQQMNSINDLHQSVQRKSQMLMQSYYRDLQQKHPQQDLAELTQSYKFSSPVSVPNRCLFKLQSHQNQINAVTYNDGGAFAITASSDCLLKIWDPSKGVQKSTLRGLSRGALDVSISTGSELILAGSTDNNAYIWGYATLRVQHTLTGHSKKVCSTAFYNSRLQALTASQDRSIKIWDANRGYCMKTLTSYSSCFGISLTPQDSILASVHFDGHLRLWTSDQGQVVEDISIIDCPLNACATSPNGDYIAVSTKNSNVFVVDLRIFEVLKELSHDRFQCPGQSKICFSSDSRFVVAGSKTGDVLVWDVNTGRVEDILSGGHINSVMAVAWKPRASQILSVDSIGGLVVWN